MGIRQAAVPGSASLPTRFCDGQAFSAWAGDTPGLRMVAGRALGRGRWRRAAARRAHPGRSNAPGVPWNHARVLPGRVPYELSIGRASFTADTGATSR